MVLVGVDVVAVAFAYWGAFALRLDNIAFADAQFFKSLGITLVCMVAAFIFGGMYRQVWRYANIDSAILVTKCVILGAVLAITANFLFLREAIPPRSVPVIFGLIATILVALLKFSWKAWASMQMKMGDETRERALIYGAGAAGDLLVRHISANSKFPYLPIGYLDDDKNKKGRVIQGLRILGSGQDMTEICKAEGVKTVIIAMHAPTGQVIRQLVARCHAAGIKPLIMPDMANSLGGTVIQPRAIDIKDLLRRSPKSIDRDRVQAFFRDRTVLISGAGGSIGSEICRQILDCKPRAIVMLDSTEYNLYRIEQELLEQDIKGVDLYPVLGSVTCTRTVERVFEKYRPSCVLHAAAYKHVPMVEANALEGIVNNILGTKTVAEAAIRFGAERFLLVSTDKAVRPTNVMGATKRCCEILVQSLHQTKRARTSFCAVRFGNVLGSSGSVIPRFLEQIQSGGPVTVTHPDVTRFFMLINEAVGLVLQSISMSKGGEVFVLDMGEPVRVYDMAKELIHLAGKQPGRDVEIVFSGLRPGEKLYEELILEGAEEHSLHEDVYIAIPNTGDPVEALADIDEVLRLAQAAQEEPAVRLLKSLANAMEIAPAPDPEQGQPDESHLH